MSHTLRTKQWLPNEPYTKLCLRLDQWAEREIAPADFLLGPFTTTTRAMLSADTGLGKTHLVVALAFAMASGTDFCHWRAKRKARVLIVDGEMPRDLIKQRLKDAEVRSGKRPEGLFVLCREDVENMPPLDSPDGQTWLDGLIEHLGGIDFLFLDNAMALTVGDLKDEEAWKPVNQWMLTLTKRRIGVLWVNHTGHDSSRSYGTKTREWQLDTVMIAEKAPDTGAEISFKLLFTKARQKRPENRDDYLPTILKLKNDRWSSESFRRLPTGKQSELALELLRQIVDRAGKPAPDLSESTRGVPLSLWREECERRGLSSSDKRGSHTKAFDRAVKSLLSETRIAIKGKMVFIS